MKTKIIILWISRALSILITLSLYAFIFEIIPSEFELSNIFIAAVPGTILLIVSAIAWFFSRPGGLIFILLGLLYAVFGWYRVPTTAITILSTGLIATGVGFLMGYGKKSENSKKNFSKLMTDVFQPLEEEPTTLKQKKKTDIKLPPPFAPIPQHIDTKDLDLEPILHEASVITPTTKSDSSTSTENVVNENTSTETTGEELITDKEEPGQFTEDIKSKDFPTKDELISIKQTHEEDTVTTAPIQKDESIVESAQESLRPKKPSLLNVFKKNKKEKESSQEPDSLLPTVEPTEVEDAKLLPRDIKNEETTDLITDKEDETSEKLPKLSLITEKAPSFQDILAKDLKDTPPDEDAEDDGIDDIQQSNDLETKGDDVPLEEKLNNVEEVVDIEERQQPVETPVVNTTTDESSSESEQLEQGETFEKVGNDFLNWFKKDKE